MEQETEAKSFCYCINNECYVDRVRNSDRQSGEPSKLRCRKRQADIQQLLRPDCNQQQSVGQGCNIMHHQEQPKVAYTARARLLEEAMEITHKDRNANYGNPEDNFKQIAKLWVAYKKMDFSTADVAVMCMLIKIARLSKNENHHDSAVDIAGYAACLADIQEENSKEAQQNSSAAGSISGGLQSAQG